MNEFIKIAIKYAHDNTHSTSRILRNIKLIRRDNELSDRVENRLKNIEDATIECINQVDKLYNLISKMNE